MIQATGYIGRKVANSISHILDLFAFAYRIIVITLANPKEGRALIGRIIVQQLYFTAIQALPVILPIALLLGSAIIIQFARLSGQYDFGRISVLLIVREVGPDHHRHDGHSSISHRRNHRNQLYARSARTRCA